MNKWINALRKEYLIGLTVMAVLVVTAFWAIQKDWSSLLSSFDSNDIGAENAEFINAGPFQLAVSVQPETPQVGKNSVFIQVRDQQGQPVPGAQVRAAGEMSAMGTMPAMYAQADIRETAPGIYQGEFELPMAGSWPLAVEVATDEAHHVGLAFDMATGRKGLRLATATPTGDLMPAMDEQLQGGSVLVDEGRRQTIGVKTGKVVREHFQVPIRLQGEITYDQTQLTDISLRFDGWIGDLKADFEGKRVKRGDILFTVYSPELLSLQEEYRETVKRSRGGPQRDALIAAGRKRLRLWGLSQTQIAWLEKQGKAQDYVPIFALGNGVVIEKYVVSGSAFKKGDRLLRLADLSTVWIESFAYEQDLPLIKHGMVATVRLPNSPERDFSAEVMQVDPFLGVNTRTARVRLLADNHDGRLKPGLFTHVILNAELGNLLLIPEDAVLVSGEKRIVFLDLGEGRLKPREIRIGHSDGLMVVVRDGLSEGDVIVTSGNFLIAAESKLKSGVDQW